MAEPSPELTRALNDMRHEFMRLHAAFYAGTLGAEEQAELAKHCNNMLEQTASIGKGTVRPPVQQVYATASELDGEEVTYLKKLQSQHTNQGFDIKEFNRVIEDPFAIKGKIVKEGDKI